MDTNSATAAWLDAFRRAQSYAVQQEIRTRLLPPPRTGTLGDIVERALSEAGVRPPQPASGQPASSAHSVDILV